MPCRRFIRFNRPALKRLNKIGRTGHAVEMEAIRHSEDSGMR